MISADDLILLDTSVLVELFRGSVSGRSIDETYSIKSRSGRPLISIITVGEIFAIAHRRAYGPQKLADLDSLLRELVIVEIKPPIAKEYAKIQVLLQNMGSLIGENDTWIAATASASRAVILTNDRDFERLPPELGIRVELVRPPKTQQ